MFPKPQRIRDPYLIGVIKTLHCTACKKSGPNDPHHVTTRGAGGGDTVDNLMPLCREHHQMLHQMGYQFMIEEFPNVLKWLQKSERFDILLKLERLVEYAD